MKTKQQERNIIYLYLLCLTQQKLLLNFYMLYFNKAAYEELVAKPPYTFGHLVNAPYTR